MAINYTQSFNAGELSRKLDGRSDLEQYKSGCRSLDNFYVLPQGGVERRAGSRFKVLTGYHATGGGDGTVAARLIPFNISADTNFLIEVGAGYLKIWDSTVTTLHHSTNSGINYTASEIDQIQYARRTDTLILTHPNHEPLKIRRITILPTFEVSEIDYIYPPLMEQNLLDTEIKADSITGTPTLTVNPDSTTNQALFYNKHIGSTWAINHVRDASERQISDKLYGNDTAGANSNVTSTSMNVSFSTWSVTTDKLIDVSRTIASASVTSNVVTLVTTQDHDLNVGDTVAVNISGGSGDAINTNVVVASITTSKTITFNFTSSSDGTYTTFTDPLTCSRNTGWKGTVTIQRSIDGGSNYADVVVLGSHTSPLNNEFSYQTPIKEDGNTFIRLVFAPNSDVIDNRVGGYLLTTVFCNELYLKGLVKITGVAGSNVVISSTSLTTNVVTVNTATSHGLTTNDFVLISGVGYSTTDPNGTYKITVSDADTFTYARTGGNETYTVSSSSILEATSRATSTVVSPLASVNFSPYWAEAFYSDYRGFPKAAELYQNRLWLTGSTDEPSTIFGSVSGDIYNFSLTESQFEPNMGIKRIIDTSEEAEYLQGKKDLFLGTDGSVISVSSADSDSLITATNINTQTENSYGSSNVQPVIANDVIVYVQRNKLKLRQLIFSREQDVFVGQDLNLLSDEITGTGIKQLFLQKNPHQIIWCIKEDGSICALSYDRVNGLNGWSNIITDGDYYSGTTLPASGEDSIYFVVNRGTTTTPKYCIEMFEDRAGLDWYVDSGVETGSSTTISIDDAKVIGAYRGAFVVNAYSSDHSTSAIRNMYKFDIPNHGLVADNILKFEIASGADDGWGFHKVQSYGLTADVFYTKGVTDVGGGTPKTRPNTASGGTEQLETFNSDPELGSAYGATSLTIITSANKGRVVIGADSHGLNNGAVSKIENFSQAPFINNTDFIVSDQTTNNFLIKDLLSNYINLSTNNTIYYNSGGADEISFTIFGSSESRLDGVYYYDGNSTYRQINPRDFQFVRTGGTTDLSDMWLLQDPTGSSGNPVTIAQQEVPLGNAPFATNNWNFSNQSTENFVFTTDSYLGSFVVGDVLLNATYNNKTNFSFTSFGNFLSGTYNLITGLSHISTKTVQVIGDSNLIDEVNLSPAITAASTSSSTNTVTCTVEKAHNYEIGDSVTVANLGYTTTNPNGTFTLSAVTNLTFSYTKSSAQNETYNVTNSPTVTVSFIRTTKQFEHLIAGLPFTSTLKPMPIEPNLVNRLSQGRTKAVGKIIARFLNTKGASVGEEGKQLTNLPVLKTTNLSGQPVALQIGQERFFIGSDYQREKILEIKQDLPYPMTVLSLATFINAEGG